MFWKKAVDYPPKPGEMYIVCEDGSDNWDTAFYYPAGWEVFNEEKSMSYLKAREDVSPEEWLKTIFGANEKCTDTTTVGGWYIPKVNENGYTYFAPLNGTGSIDKIWYAEVKVPRKVWNRK